MNRLRNAIRDIFDDYPLYAFGVLFLCGLYVGVLL